MPSDSSVDEAGRLDLNAGESVEGYNGSETLIHCGEGGEEVVAARRSEQDAVFIEENRSSFVEEVASEGLEAVDRASADSRRGVVDEEVGSTATNEDEGVERAESGGLEAAENLDGVEEGVSGDSKKGIVVEELGSAGRNEEAQLEVGEVVIREETVVCDEEKQSTVESVMEDVLDPGERDVVVGSMAKNEEAQVEIDEAVIREEGVERAESGGLEAAENLGGVEAGVSGDSKKGIVVEEFGSAGMNEEAQIEVGEVVMRKETVVCEEEKQSTVESVMEDVIDPGEWVVVVGSTEKNEEGHAEPDEAVIREESVERAESGGLEAVENLEGVEEGVSSDSKKGIVAEELGSAGRNEEAQVAVGEVVIRKETVVCEEETQSTVDSVMEDVLDSGERDVVVDRSVEAAVKVAASHERVEAEVLERGEIQVEEIHKGDEVVKNDAMGHNSVDGQLDPEEKGVVVEGSIETLDVDIAHEGVETEILERDKVEVAKIHKEDEVVENSDAVGHNSVDGQLKPAGDNVDSGSIAKNQSEVVMEVTDGKEDIGGNLSLGIIQETELEFTGGEIEVANVSMVDDDHGGKDDISIAGGKEDIGEGLSLGINEETVLKFTGGGIKVGDEPVVGDNHEGKTDIGEGLSLGINQETTAKIKGGETEVENVSMVDDDHDRKENIGIIGGKENIGEGLSLGINLETVPEFTGGKTEVEAVSIGDDDHDVDHEASIMQIARVDTNQDIQEEDNSTSDSALVEDNINQESDHDKKDSNVVNPAVVHADVISGDTEADDPTPMDVDQDRDHEPPISQTSLAGTNKNTLEEGDRVLNSVPIVGDVVHEVDHVEKVPKSADSTGGAQPQVIGRVAEVGDGSLMESSQGNDHEVSILPTSLVEPNRDIQKEVDPSLDSVPVASLQAHIATQDPNQTNAFIEFHSDAIGVKTELVDGPVLDGWQDRDHEASVLQTFAVDTHQKIQEDGDSDLGSVHVDETISQRADQCSEGPNSADVDVEIQPDVMDRKVGDNSMKDSDQKGDHESSIMQSSSLETNQSVQEGNSLLDSVPVDDIVSNQAACVVDDPVLADRVVELAPLVISKETTLGVGSVMDGDQDRDKEASVSMMHLVTILEEGNTPVDGLTGHRADHVTEDPNEEEPVVKVQTQEIGMETELIESVMVGDQNSDFKASILQIYSAEAHANIQEEGTSVLDSVPVDGTTNHRADFYTGDPNPYDPVIKAEPQVIIRETEVGDSSMMDYDHGSDPKISTLQTSSVDNDEDIQEQGEPVLDSVPANGIVSYQEDNSTEDPTAADPVAAEVQVKVIGGVAETSVVSIVDGNESGVQEASISQMSLLDTKENQEEGDTAMDSVPVDMSQQADHTSKDSNPLDALLAGVQVKVMGGETEVGVQSVTDGSDGRCQEASVSQIPLVDNKLNIQEEEAKIEAMGGETEVIVVPMMDCSEGRDQDASVSQMSSVDTDQNIQEGTTMLDSVPLIGETSHLADNISKDPNPPPLPTAEAQIKIMGGETEVNVGFMMDGSEGRDQKACVSQMLSVDTSQIIRGEDAEAQTEVMIGKTEVNAESMMGGSEGGDHDASVSQMSLADTNQNIREIGSTMLDSVPFVGSISNQVDNISKDPKPLAVPVAEVQVEEMGGETEMSGSMTDDCESRDHETSVSQVLLVDTNYNIQEEGDIVLDSVPFDGSVNHQADLIAKGSDLPAVENEKPQAKELGTVVVDGPDLDADQDTDYTASPEMSLMDFNQSIQEEGSTLLNSVPVVEAINLQVDNVTEDWSSSDLVAEVQNRDAHSDALTTISIVEARNGDTNSVADSLMGGVESLTADVGLTESVTELVAAGVDVHSVDENAEGMGDDVTLYANTVDELHNGGIQLIETENAGTGSHDGGSMNIGDIVTENPTSVAEISVLQASELLEIHAVASQGKESGDFLLGENLEKESQSVGSLVNRSLDGNAHELESLLIGSKDLVVEPDVMTKDFSQLDDSYEKLELVQELKAKQDIPAPNNMDNVIVDEGSDGEQKVQGAEVLLQGVEKEVMSGSGVCFMENNQQVNYYLCPLEKAELPMSDLVWGKVKSHPWWPGQVFDPSDASEMALKHQKKDNFLVAYFGDKTFAWCDESQLKPFHAHFSQMEKQSSSDTFVNAVSDILMEVSRRVELGMTCSCLPEAARASIMYQEVENAGIREGSVESVLDKSLIVNYFQPDRLREYIEALAMFPHGGVDKLELMIAQSQLKAFYRLKGYSELPIFTVGGGLIENGGEVLPATGERSGEDAAGHLNPAPSDLISEKGRLKSRERSINKRKHVWEDGSRKKSTPELVEEENALHLADSGKSESGVKTAEKSMSCSVKRIAVESDAADSERLKRRALDSFGDIETKAPSPTVTSSFKIGECIRRAASQLTGAPPILRSHGETSRTDYRGGDIASFDDDAYILVENRNTKINFSEDYSSTDDVLSQLCLAARDPLKGYSFVPKIVSFFTSFRNSCVSSSSEDMKPVEKRKRGRPRKVNLQPASSDVPAPDHMKDSYWSDSNLQNRPRRRRLSNGLKTQGESLVQNQRRRQKSAGEFPLLLPSGPTSDTEQQLQVGAVNTNMKYPFVVERPIISVEEKIVDECMPTALILCFNNSNSLPSLTDLIRIFSRYGPLKEAETDVLRKTNRAKVVFKRRADAEVAFSSAGKYSIFGPGLLSYRLKYLPSTTDSAPHTVHQDNQDATHITKPQDDDAAPINTPENKHDPTLITSRQESDDAEPITTTQDKLDALPNIALQDNCDVTPTTMPEDNHDALLISTSRDNHDAEPVTTPQDNHGAASISTSQDNYAAANITRPQEKYDATPVSTPQDDHAAAPITTPQDNNDVSPISTSQSEHEETPISRPQDKYNTTSTKGSTLEISDQAEAAILLDSMQIEAAGKGSSE